MRIELNCAEWGKNSFNLIAGAEGNCLIRCDLCGHEIGTMAELKEAHCREGLEARSTRDSSEP